MSTPIYNKRDIERILKKNGYVLHHQKGSHLIYRNENGRHLTIGICKYNKMVFQRLIKEYDLKVN